MNILYILILNFCSIITIYGMDLDRYNKSNCPLQKRLTVAYAMFIKSNEASNTNNEKNKKIALAITQSLEHLHMTENDPNKAVFDQSKLKPMCDRIINHSGTIEWYNYTCPCFNSYINKKEKTETDTQNIAKIILAKDDAQVALQNAIEATQHNQPVIKKLKKSNSWKRFLKRLSINKD